MFLFQEVQRFVLVALVAYVVTLAKAEAMEMASVDAAHPMAYLSNESRRGFHLWQVRSVILVFAFAPWTFFHWRMFFVIEESRYIASAIVIHLVWAASWVAISVAPFIAMENWQKRLAMSLECPSEIEVKRLQQMEPVSRGAIVVSAIGGLASILYPIIRGLS